jgi:hypothetical protein
VKETWFLVVEMFEQMIKLIELVVLEIGLIVINQNILNLIQLIFFTELLKKDVYLLTYGVYL